MIKQTKILKASAYYDLVIISPFILPATLTHYLSLLEAIGKPLGIEDNIPLFQATHLLLGVLLGWLVIAWSLLKLYTKFTILNFFDGVTRIVFALWIAYFIVFLHVSRVFWVFAISEVVWGALQLLSCPFQTRKLDQGQ